MNLFHVISDKVNRALAALAEEGALPPEMEMKNVSVEPPRDPAHGDVTTNAAMVLAKQTKKPPRELAQLIAEKLEGDADLATVEIAGPGFINMRLSPAFRGRVMASIL